MKIKAADLFCGAGGTSTGLVEACEERGHSVELTAINHWDIAIETHTKNHPGARHLCTSLDAVDPRKLYREGELDLLWASPECTHHSIARGGKPICDQSRSTAWCVVRWAEALRPSIILIENVKEFETWGPIGTNGRPMNSRKGEVFHAWKAALEAIGYRVDWRILCAADYGDPTTRRRLFVYAVRGRRKIIWPEPTHAPSEDQDLISSRKPWRAAREIIDWTVPGKSIFNRKKHLGLCEPYLVQTNHGNGSDDKGDERRVRSLKKPLPTVAGNRGEWALLKPFIVPQERFNQQPVDSVDSPLRTITAQRTALDWCNR